MTLLGNNETAADLGCSLNQQQRRPLPSSLSRLAEDFKMSHCPPLNTHFTLD